MACRSTTLRLHAAFAAPLVLAAPSLAEAQAWSPQVGIVARGEYNDNYFLSSEDKQSAFTTSVTPFVTAYRRTEVSDVAAVAALGYNWVSGLSPSTDYVSALGAIFGTLRDGRSTWAGYTIFSRSAALQAEAQNADVVLGLAYTNATTLNGTYTYALTERWSLGAAASAYDNRYDGVSTTGSFVNNHGYYAGGTANYAYSEYTQLSAAAGYSNYASDLSDSDSVTATLGVVYKFSPELTVSASAGAFWIDTTVAQGIGTGGGERASGGLYGGQITYLFSNDAKVVASLTESISPTSAGLVSKNSSGGILFTARFSDRLTGRLGGGYTRTTFPQAQTSALDYTYYQGEVGLSYQLAERWTIDAGYRYTRATYAQSASDAASNVAFVGIGYNWPSSTFTGWVGRPTEVQGAPGAGPVTRPEKAPGGDAPPSPGTSPFDPFTIP